MVRHAELGERVDDLQDDEKTDDDERGQLHDADEDPQEDEGRHARGRIHDEVRPEHARERTRRADHRLGRDEPLADRGDDPAEEIEDQVWPAAQAVLHVVAEDPEIEHVPKDVQPAAVQEDVREEGHEQRDGELPVRDRARERGPVERVPVVERVERGWRSREAERVEPDENVRGDEQAVHHRGAPRRVRVVERDHRAVSSVTTILEPCSV